MRENTCAKVRQAVAMLRQSAALLPVGEM